MTSHAPFIVLDGLDGTGKSTQSRLLLDWLHERGIAAVRCSDPGTLVMASCTAGMSLYTLICTRRTPNSVRQSRKFIVNQKAAIPRNVRRAYIKCQGAGRFKTWPALTLSE